MGSRGVLSLRRRAGLTPAQGFMLRVILDQPGALLSKKQALITSALQSIDRADGLVAGRPVSGERHR